MTPSTPALVVLLKIGAMFLVMLVGWVARRRNYLTAETTSTLSRFVVDLAFPALAFTQMLRTTTGAGLREGWVALVLGAGIILLSHLVGWLGRGLAKHPAQRGTFIFLVAVPNWTYLPLVIAAELFGDEGVRTVLLVNLSVQLVFWTLEVWTLRGGALSMSSIRQVLVNPGILATVFGVAIALLAPGTRGLEFVNPVGAAGWELAGGTVVQALALVGSLTIPLSLLVTGAQLGSLDISDHRPSRALVGVLGLRLVVAPAVCIAVFWAVSRVVVFTEAVRLTLCVTAAMPVAVSCGILTERFGGDTSLAARAIFYSTLASLVTVPAVVWIVQQLGW